MIMSTLHASTANVMGGHYLSGDINIGPAMIFGYIAARHVAGADGNCPGGDRCGVCGARPEINVGFVAQ